MGDFKDLVLPIVLLVLRDGPFLQRILQRVDRTGELEGVTAHKFHQLAGHPIKYDGEENFLAFAIFAEACLVRGL